MASVNTSSGQSKWGRRSLNMQINLIPYIDLMTTLVVFLMVTAVWTQVAALEVQNVASGSGAQAPAVVPLRIILTQNALTIEEERGTPILLPLKSDGYDLDALLAELRRLKAKVPERNQVEIQAADRVVFSQLVGVVDQAVAAGLTGVALGG